MLDCGVQDQSESLRGVAPLWGSRYSVSECWSNGQLPLQGLRAKLPKPKFNKRLTCNCIVINFCIHVLIISFVFLSPKINKKTLVQLWMYALSVKPHKFVSFYAYMILFSLSFPLICFPNTEIEHSEKKNNCKIYLEEPLLSENHQLFI